MEHLGESAQQWTSHYLNANNATLHYWQSVPPLSPSLQVPLALPILVFLHGMILSSSCLIVPARAFTKNFTVVLPDNRGHGLSVPIPKGSFTMDNLVADALAVIRHVSTDGPILLAGHSMGAATVARIARAHPDLVAGVLLEEPPWNRPPGEPYSSGAYQNVTAQKVDTALVIAAVNAVKNLTESEFIASDADGTAFLEFPAEDDLRAVRRFDTEDITAEELLAMDVENTVAIYGITVPVILQIGDIGTSSETQGSKLNPPVAKQAVGTYPRGKLSCFVNGTHHLHHPLGPTRDEWAARTLAYFLSFPRNGTRLYSGQVHSNGSDASCTIPSWSVVEPPAVERSLQ